LIVISTQTQDIGTLKIVKIQERQDNGVTKENDISALSKIDSEGMKKGKFPYVMYSG